MEVDKEEYADNWDSIFGKKEKDLNVADQEYIDSNLQKEDL